MGELGDLGDPREEIDAELDALGDPCKEKEPVELDALGDPRKEKESTELVGKGSGE